MKKLLDNQPEVVPAQAHRIAPAAHPAVSHLPVSRSILSPDGLADVVKANYPIASPTNFRFLKFSANDTYALDTPDGQYIARLYAVRWRSYSEIQYELELLRHLHAKGVAVAPPTPCLDGALTCPVATPEGTRQLALFAFIQGTTLSWEKVKDWELAGDWAAQFHTATEDFTSRWSRPRLDAQRLIDAPLAAIRPFLNRRSDFRDYLEQFAERLRSRLNRAIQAGLTAGICHGDFEAKNIQITDDRRASVLDFDMCAPGWRAFDFAAIYMAAKREQPENIWTAFLRGYRQRSSLRASDLAAVPLFAPLQCLSALRMFADNAADWGTINISDGNLEYWEKYLTEWERNTPDMADAPIKSKSASATRSDSTDIARLPASPMLPVTHSVIAPDTVRGQVAGAFEMGDLRSCQLICSGSSDTYLLETADRQYVARVYRAGWRSASDIQYELALLGYLAASGISVPVPINSKRGALAQPLSAPEGIRYLAMFNYLEGTPLSFDNVDNARLAGQAAAKIHSAADRFATPCTRPALDLPNMIEKPLEVIRPLLESRPDAWDYIRGLAARVRERADAVITSDLDWGLCHGDFGRKNLLLKPNGELIVLDFDNCAMGWRAYDFTSVFGEARGMGRMDLYDAFVKGYTLVRPLPEKNLELVPLFRGLRHLCMLGVFAQNAPAWGVAAIRGKNLDGWLKYLRDWEDAHLQSRNN